MVQQYHHLHMFHKNKVVRRILARKHKLRACVTTSARCCTLFAIFVAVFIFSGVNIGIRTDSSDTRASRAFLRELSSCDHGTAGVVSEAELQHTLDTRNWNKNHFSSWKRALKLQSNRKYFFALNLRDNEEMIPFTFSAIIKACLVLSEGWRLQSCFISIYESGSTDHTRDLIHQLDAELKNLGIPHKFVVDGIRRDGMQHRIDFLAKVRNNALTSFYANISMWDEVIFLNDVAICASSILELLAQKNFHHGDVASGMDYNTRVVDPDVGPVAEFYDIWVNKDMSGQRFQNSRPYIGDPVAWDSFSSGVPFQVFATWAGGIVISAELFAKYDVRFRHSGLLECAACECELLIRDLWHQSGTNGLKVMVVPTVYSAYSVEEFQIVRRDLELTFKFEFSRGKFVDPIVFSKRSPETIDCSSLEFAGEHLVDYDTLNVKSNWLWWYSVDRELPERELPELLRLASHHIAQSHSSFCTPSSSRIPANLHFVLPVTEPLQIPHIAFMNMLQWVRLNPCFKVHIHTKNSFSSMAAQGGWSISNLRELSDSRLHYLKYYTQFRLQGLMALHLFGGVFADWEFSPTAPIDLAQLDLFGAAFHEASYGGGPYIIASVPSSRELHDVINFALKMSENPLDPSEVDIEFLRQLSASDMHLRLAMLTIGKLNFQLAGVSYSSPHLTSLGKMRIRPLPHILSQARPDKLRDGDTLLDGEILLSSRSEGSSKRLWQFPKASVSSLQNNSFYLQLGTAKQRGKTSQYGCLELRSGSTIHGSRSDNGVWQECWPSQLELDNTYLLYHSGIASVVTVANEICGRAPEEKVLWSLNFTADHILSDGEEYELYLDEDGLLTSSVKKSPRKGTDEAKFLPDFLRACTSAVRISASGSQGCEYLEVWQRQVARYHSSCSSIM